MSLLDDAPKDNNIGLLHCPSFVANPSDKIPSGSSKEHVALQCVHYTPQNDTSTQDTAQMREKIASYLCDTSRPVSFTPDERYFIIDTDASIRITNNHLDFLFPPRPVTPTQIKRYCGWSNGRRYWEHQVLFPG